jgi:hypothetical protein
MLRNEITEHTLFLIDQEKRKNYALAFNDVSLILVRLRLKNQQAASIRSVAKIKKYLRQSTKRKNYFLVRLSTVRTIKYPETIANNSWL